MLFVLSGASAAGKTTLRHALSDRAGVVTADLDQQAPGRPNPVLLDKRWRAEQTEAWLQVALEHQRDGQDFVLFGGVLGELLACPSATELDGIAGALLDCDDAVRVERLRARGAVADDELWHHVIWAAWLRLHRTDPQWLRHVITRSLPGEREVAPWLEWSRWSSWHAGDPRWRFELVSTSEQPVDETAAWIADWIETTRRGEPALRGRWWDEAV